MIDGLRDRLSQFLKDKTYTYIRDSFDLNFNGYILEIKEKTFLFKDDVLGEIEIGFELVKKINYSNREK